VPVIVADSAWHRLRSARQAGVPVYFGDLLSEHAEHALELGAFGSLLAATNNDAYNALACARFAPELGRQNIFQLAGNDSAEPHKPAPELRGRTAMGQDVQFEDLQRRWYQGWGFRCNELTDTFDAKAFTAALPDGAVPVLVIGTSNAIRLLEADKPLRAESGERVVWLGPKGSEEAHEPDERAADRARPLV
jgi:hypothetical protein